jgi:hypothetical protein
MSHTCHADGCKVAVSPKLFMCASHWAMVPHPLQREVWKHYRPGQEVDKKPTREYLAVTARARAAVAAQERLNSSATKWIS